MGDIEPASAHGTLTAATARLAKGRVRRPDRARVTLEETTTRATARVNFARVSGEDLAECRLRESRTPHPTHRWLSNAESDHVEPCHDGAQPRPSPAQELRTRRSHARGPRRQRRRPAGQGRVSGGWRRTRPQTELAESEERDPPTGPARHQLPARHRGLGAVARAGVAGAEVLATTRWPSRR
jgi:hypothetical protein